MVINIKQAYFFILMVQNIECCYQTQKLVLFMIELSFYYLGYHGREWKLKQCTKEQEKPSCLRFLQRCKVPLYVINLSPLFL